MKQPVKQKVIRINDVFDIDTSKITVYDLNNRYVDSQGNLFRLKIDPFTKKIEIIKILRSNPEEAHMIQNKMMQRKVEESKFQTKTESFQMPELDPSIFDEPFNPDEVLNRTFALMTLHMERLKGIVMNLRNSKLAEKIAKEDTASLNDIYKNIEIDGIQQITKVENYQKELTGYPKHITYYQARMNNATKAILSKLELNNQKAMKYIMFFEMHAAIKMLYTKLSSLLGSISEFVNKNNEPLKDLFDPRQKRSFDDAIISIDTTISEIKEVEKNLLKMQAFLNDPDIVPF